VTFSVGRIGGYPTDTECPVAADAFSSAAARNQVEPAATLEPGGGSRPPGASHPVYADASTLRHARSQAATRTPTQT
jgi:hypothetical protein